MEFPTDIPRQHNGCDCGVFTLMYADRRGAGLDFDFDQSDMERLRAQVLRRLLLKHID